MSNMTWTPNDRDTKVNQYLDKINHAPYGVAFYLVLGLICLFTGVVLFGGF